MRRPRPSGRSVLPTRAAVVAEQIREMIRSGELPAGTRLRQAHLAAQLGVSTTPVREAFVALAREGLVRQNAHRGAVVFSRSAGELTQLYEIRLALEPLATEIAATQLGEDDLVALDQALTQKRTTEPERFLELNGEFHDRIYAAACRPRLREMIEEVRDPAAHYLRVNLDLYDAAYRAEVQAEHEAIFAALRAHAPKRACRAMREHLEHSARHIEGLIRTQAPAQSQVRGSASPNRNSTTA